VSLEGASEAFLLRLLLRRRRASARRDLASEVDEPLDVATDTEVADEERDGGEDATDREPEPE
jgi:hypothetical protein